MCNKYYTYSDFIIATLFIKKEEISRCKENNNTSNMLCDRSVYFVANNYVVITNGLAGNTVSVITLCYKLNLLCMIGFYLPTIPVLPPHEPFVSHPLSDFHCDRHYIDFPNHSYDISVIQSIRLHH